MKGRYGKKKEGGKDAETGQENEEEREEVWGGEGDGGVKGYMKDGES